MPVHSVPERQAKDGMKRHERTRRKAERLKSVGVRRALRSTRWTNPVGRAAIRDGNLAARAFHESQALLNLADDQERAVKNEKEKRKIKKDWWRPETSASKPVKETARKRPKKGRKKAA